ncbi:hypothetical protein BMETH_1077_2 [methanotrophic bacterial endosymbiont of Bathymodiolus sp.]|nr:hypothetical protein BMETH_1077_2 [methanotrophic bacterial endosymbiont of Bathymodiolus sp.]
MLHGFWIGQHFTKIHHIVIPASKRRTNHRITSGQYTYIITITIGVFTRFNGTA